MLATGTGHESQGGPALLQRERQFYVHPDRHSDATFGPGLERPLLESQRRLRVQPRVE